ncbi:MAG: type II secretion system F family protein [Acidobacteriota bacterium]|nr:type II secretion system F family protein [Blastocatellia bacterium]MDW8240875.1 type II secretion system F family protein [Acidobacteriota bacterium]
MIALLVFITFVLFAIGIYMFFYKEQQEMAEKVDERLESLLRSEVGQKSEELQILREDIASQLSSFNRFVLKSSLGNRLYQLIEQADVNMRPMQVILLCIVLSAFTGIFLWYIRGSALVAFVIGAIASTVPILYLLQMRKKRLALFLEQLPDALDLVTRALRAGHAFTSALQTVATEMPDPIAKEFRRTSEETNLGMSLKASLEHLTERIPILDLKLAVTAILIQRETGGNLAEILENIADVIRERFKILGQVRVYTAQGRLTGWVIGLIPFGLMVYIYIVNPDYISVLFTHPMGKMMLIAGLISEALGVLVIRKIVRIKV